jgi:hypothetical protein
MLATSCLRADTNHLCRNYYDNERYTQIPTAPKRSTFNPKFLTSAIYRMNVGVLELVRTFPERWD